MPIRSPLYDMKKSFLFRLKTYLFFTLLIPFISSITHAVEFELGRTPPAKNNLPTLGSGLAMGKDITGDPHLENFPDGPFLCGLKQNRIKKEICLVSSAMKITGRRIV